ncbi:hypothetical protein jhhlp_005436 [Lomentospora prolificans]|uniref:Peroxin domain-containing protein n=1 Tax=Lomentospora prolificans TaxID=41688 RepID=A0A2N3N6T4_9PEZI|nr:hypothetical protein jhhlp_005436 [Lomentospora prolificans]
MDSNQDSMKLPPVYTEQPPAPPPENPSGTQRVIPLVPPKTPPPQEVQQDGLPSQSTPSLGDSEPEVVEAYEHKIPTASHQLAEETKDKPVEEKGYAELNHGETEIKDRGWNASPANVPDPLVGGLTNEQVWLLVRRFNKQIFHVKSLSEPPLGGLDLTTASEEEFSPDKLRAHLERFYMSVVVSLFAFWKHIVRLRSWRETRRTISFMAVYSLAWILDLVIPTIIGFVMVLILSPASRTYCFPPAPPSVIDSKTGGLKKPDSGVLGSGDSVTGAPEKHHGEAVEQEAHNFVATISSLIVSTAAGKHPQGDLTQGEDDVPDPTEAAANLVDAKESANGGKPNAHHDKAKQPVSASVWTTARPVMHGLSTFVDNYERLGNALSPTAPFPRQRPRLILASCLAPMLLGSFFTTSYMAMKGMGFAVGFALFGDPIIQRGLVYINRTYPRWKKYIELQNTLLKGVPTNAQLTLTLLRIGERNKAPLPPPPSSDAPPSLESQASPEDLNHLAEHPPAEAGPEADGSHKKEGKGHKIMRFFKGATKGGINTTEAADKVKAKVGATHAKQRLGVIRRDPYPDTGPVQFPARWKGKKGHAYLTSTATTPALSWTSEIRDMNPAWSVTIEDIVDVRKVGGLGWKSKILVGWATNNQVADGLVIRDVLGHEYHITAILTRDELFNRLVAMGSQMWEAW